MIALIGQYKLPITIGIDFCDKIIKSYFIMFYGNSELLEKTLHNDLNTLIKNVKAREDQHLTLLQYNKGLIEQLSEMDSIPFFQEELTKYRSFLDSMKTSDAKVKKQQDQMLEKYECVLSGQSSIIKLMGRVTARVIQILQASLEKAKSLDEKLQKRYLTLKNALLELVEGKDKIDIQGFLEVIIFHVQLKSKEEINQLQKIISILVSGNFSQLGNVYQPIKKEPPPLEQKLVNPTPSLQKREFKKNSLERSKEKFEKMREEAKQIEKLKKKKEKLAIRMLTTLYNPMQLSKNQFMQDMVFTNREYKEKELYEQVFSRNKFNHAQILQFEAKKDKFEMKVKAFKEKMEKESKKIQQALVFINHNFISTVSETNAHRFKQPLTPVPARLSLKKQNLQYTSSRKETKSEADEDQFETEQSKMMLEKELMFRKRDYRFLSKAPTPKSSKKKQGLYSSMQSTQEGFNYRKLNIQNEQETSKSSNKAKLPQIPGRSSLDYRYEQKKRADPQKRINIAKNIEIGNIINPQLKPLNPQNNLRSGRKSPRQRHTPSTNIGFEYIFYVNKKSNKVQQDSKNNFLF